MGGDEVLRQNRSLAVAWVSFLVVALLALDIVEGVAWGLIVPSAALVLVAIVPAMRPADEDRRIDRRDLVVVGSLYAGVVILFRIAFVAFGTDDVAGLFLAFAAGLVLGVVGPLIYSVRLRGRRLGSLGIGHHRLRETLLLGLLLAAVQFSMTLWGYDLPTPVDWVPLLVMSLVVGFFEAVFFRGFVQGRLQASFGTVAGIAVAAVLYSLYHVGYGMGADELVFLFGLGVVYAIAYSLVSNVLVLWPLLTPLGAFFNNLEAGDIDLPWASIAGFADVAVVMGVAVLLAYRYDRKRASLAARGYPDAAEVET
ncbi:MAG: CPBP family intramembrane metalloprotease [Acidimicrobiia bacterium]|nr:CPBP family intramembrane metalloprotease [Acidimicrobiia bacterium]